jgi:hypothetical protein
MKVAPTQNGLRRGDPLWSPSSVQPVVPNFYDYDFLNVNANPNETPSMHFVIHLESFRFRKRTSSCVLELTRCVSYFENDLG